MEKKDVRKFVQAAVQNIFLGNNNESVLHNIKICYEDDGDFWSSGITLKQYLYGKWELVKTFWFYRHYANYWELVNQPWVCDMVTEITNETMKFIKEPGIKPDFDFNIYK